MGPVLDKAQMTEEDIKLQFITPAITGKWPKSLITMETKITDGNWKRNCMSFLYDLRALSDENRDDRARPK